MANEKRLIDAHDLWSDIMMLPHNGDMISSEEVEQAIEDAPTVDAVEVVHGRWEWITEDIYGCTNCGARNHVKEVMGQPDYNYCPNCGAKMDEERK